jgi:alpha-ribazole phosphatase
MLIIVRHGRTRLNAEGRLQGRVDAELDELGRRQAEAIAAAVTRQVGEIAAIISSPLQRARQTAEAFGVTPQIDERWTELDYGVLDGMPVKEVPAEVWQRWREDLSFAPEGGESHLALHRRIREACADVSEAARHHHIVVVTHVSPIKSAAAWAMGLDGGVPWRAFVEQASITRIGVDAAGPVLRTFSETAHLVDVSEATVSRSVSGILSAPDGTG